ncbi:dephospho-CoA kinase [Actinomycetota bacterium]
MLRIGLTGGIGSGKSTAAARFTALGATVVDADKLAREVVAPGTDGLAAIRERFGDDVIAEDGSLDRPALGAIVFGDEQARRDLEQITHPRIAARTAELVSAAPDDGILVHDVPLLVEKDMGAAYHLVVVVGADEDTRVRRLVEHRGFTEDHARARIRNQASDEQRHRAADVWLENSGRPEVLVRRVEGLWHKRLQPFAANLATGSYSRRPELLALSAPDPTWPDQGARMIARLRRALGDVAHTIDHVGSTSVPGLIAKNVIDIQVGVASLDDVDTAEVVSSLAAAGFPRATGEWSDQPRDYDDAPTPKRMHGSADPDRVAHIHIREVGSPAWRDALLFRDWLRADEEVRTAYAAEKLRLAAELTSTSAYAEGKEPWFAAVWPHADEWAEETGWTPGA